MAYDFDSQAVRNAFRDYVMAQLNLQGITPQITIVPFTKTIMQYPWATVVPPLTMIETEHTIFRRGVDAANNYNLRHTLTIWRIVQRTIGSNAEDVEENNLTIFAQTLAEDYRAGGLLAGSEIDAVLVGDSSMLSHALEAAGFNKSLTGVGLQVCIERISSRTLS